MSKNLKGKSYNEVMNEWAAQRSFLQRASQGLMRPGYGVTGLARAWGWFWRLFLFVSIPVLLYMGWMRIHAKSGPFTAQLAAETKRYLGAESVVLRRTRWDWNGELRMEHIKAKGAPANIFSEMEIANLTTWIRVPHVFRKDWHLKNVSCFSAKLALRAGSSGKTAGLTDQDPAFLTAGWGISPDFSQLTIDSYDCDKLTLLWGGSPANSGAVRDSSMTLKRSGSGWDMALAKGTFQQGWIEGLNISKALVSLTPDAAVISQGDFTVLGGGSGTLTGRIGLGEVPEVDLTLNVENLAFEPLLPEYFRRMVKAVVRGKVAISGSTNRTSGVILDSRFTVDSGVLSGIPVFRALELATGEAQLAQPQITAGTLNFKSQGSEETGGLLIEGSDILLECGTRMKIGFNFRHERKQVLASSVKEAATAESSVALSTSGTLRIGLPADSVAKMKPSIRQQFFTSEEGGLLWMQVPFRMEEGDFTKSAADRIVELHYGGS